MLPKLVIVSDTIRRDLHIPLRLFKRFEVVHLYRAAGYKDMSAKDFQKPKAVHFRNVSDLYRKLVECRPTIIQAAEPWANKVSFLIAWTVWRYAKKYPVKAVMPVFENVPLKNKLSLVKYRLCCWLMKKIDPRITVYFILNRGARKNLIDLGVKKEKTINMMWGSWGIDLNSFKSIPQPVKNEKLKAKSILFLGRISKAKGIPQLLKMFDIVKKEVKDAKLVIAGPKGDASHLIKKKSTYGVDHLGIIKNREVPKLLNSVDILVMPSQTTKQWDEQVGMVGLQALACGVPIITTNAGAISEYFKQNQGSQIVDEKDTDRMAQLAVKLLTDRKIYSAQSRLGRRYVEQNFDQKKIVATIEKILSSLI